MAAPAQEILLHPHPYVGDNAISHKAVNRCLKDWRTWIVLYYTILYSTELYYDIRRASAAVAAKLLQQNGKTHVLLPSVPLQPLVPCRNSFAAGALQ